MAKVNIEIDTEQRTMAVLVNGEAQSDVKYVTCYMPNVEVEKRYGYKETMCSIEKCTKADDVRKYETIQAGEKDFTVVEDNKKIIAKDLSKLFAENMVKAR